MQKGKIVLIVLAATLLLHPTRKLPSIMRRDILKLTPIGSSWDEVNEVIGENENWRRMNRSREFGYNGHGGGYRGGMYIMVSVNNSGIFYYKVIIWGFDEDGILIEVFVERDLVL